MKKRMMASVPKASVIITNPTHYSVALSYERGMSAPVCVAKGVDNIALKIREIARKHDIPIVENVPLARALYATVEIDDEIPVEHYHAVAEIIGYVMGLKRGLSGAADVRGTGQKSPGNAFNLSNSRLMDLRLPVRFRHSGGARKPGASTFAPRRRAASLHMTAETDSHPPPEPFAAHEPARRSGSIVLVLLVAAGIVAVAVALMTIGRAQAQPYILGVLALLAMVGLFNLFAFAAGIIRFTDRTADDPVMGRIADHAYDGLAVTDPAAMWSIPTPPIWR